MKRCMSISANLLEKLGVSNDVELAHRMFTTGGNEHLFSRLITVVACFYFLRRVVLPVWVSACIW